MDERSLQLIRAEFSDIFENLKRVQSEELYEKIYLTAYEITHTFNNGGKLLIAGNGGSAADAQHIAAEFTIRLSAEDKRNAYPAIALNTDTSIITACGNDMGFEQIFSRQIEALGKKGDVFLGISTSGRSPNILRAFEKCSEMFVKKILLTGESILNDNVDIMISACGKDTSQIQVLHSLIEHLIVRLVISMN